MKKLTIAFLFFLGVCFILVACSENGDKSSHTKSDNNNSADTTETNDNKKEKLSDNDTSKQDAAENLSLPDNFPGDFPLPEGMIITKISDDSDEDTIDYYIDFDLKEIDTDVIFEMYREYVEKVDYFVQKDGELKNLDDVYQFAAYESSEDMFVITLRPEEDNGVIQIKSKNNH